MSAPSGIPSSRRITASVSMFGENDCASANTMNMTIVPRNITRLPTRSINQPPHSEPTIAPAWVPADARPSSKAGGWYCAVRNTSKNEIEYRSQASMKIEAIIIQPMREPLGLYFWMRCAVACSANCCCSVSATATRQTSTKAPRGCANDTGSSRDVAFAPTKCSRRANRGRWAAHGILAAAHHQQVELSLQRIYHITRSSDWRAAVVQGSYRLSTRDRTLHEVGFIHCSHVHQVAGVANAIYHDERDLVVLVIDADRLDAPLRSEPALVDGGGEVFPHIYGPLNLDAVVEVRPYPPLHDGSFGPPAP